MSRRPAPSDSFAGGGSTRAGAPIAQLVRRHSRHRLRLLRQGLRRSPRKRS
ncbi:hypothetical protein ACFPK5_01290 [Streptomyces beijiangensis]|uniref:hypothetical protein n=1 Tax=Streptomyces beijiangensis TaxID=163361 RepID=UPI0036073E67